MEKRAVSITEKKAETPASKTRSRDVKTASSVDIAVIRQSGLPNRTEFSLRETT